MIKINLLREGRGATRAAAAAPGAAAAGPANRNLILLVAIFALGALLGGGWTLVKWRGITAKRAEVTAREEEAAKLKKIIEEVERFEKRRDSLEKRIALINQLKQNQKGPVRLLDRISRDLPDLVWLDRMQLSGSQITISGRTLNPNAAATFVENIKGDPMFDEPEFNNLAAQGRDDAVYRFDMRFNFRYQGDDAAAAAEGVAGAGATAPAPAPES
ncbi:MAG TPA: PilN domain-containing protein [Thermoanaerobaculia bacterium]|nr:PilN domain-containing protein [Thermoanaerobaculia bacterium]